MGLRKESRILLGRLDKDGCNSPMRSLFFRLREMWKMAADGSSEKEWLTLMLEDAAEVAEVWMEAE